MSGFQASAIQRRKVRGCVCRVCGSFNVDPAHVLPRSLGGCDHEDCVIPLCRRCHRRYDHERLLDVVPVLTLAEQAHAVSHVGLISALQRASNLRWQPLREVA